MATSAEAECHPNPLSIAAYSTCPSGLWHEAIAPLLTAPEMVMLNIGANNGYNLVEFVQRYSAAPANLTHANWYSLLREHGCAAQCCGVCGLCRAQRIKQQATASVHLHAFELQQANAQMLQKLVRLAGLPVSVHSVAVSNATGTVYTASDVKPGSESVGIAKRAGNAKRLVARPVTTVDAFMAGHGVPRAHFVSIDTEGYDRRHVRHGARAHREAHRRTGSSSTAGRRCCKRAADAAGGRLARAAVCFWQGNRGALAQISAGCYQEETRNRFGFARSNAVCTHRADVIGVFRKCQRKPFCRS